MPFAPKSLPRWMRARFLCTVLASFSIASPLRADDPIEEWHHDQPMYGGIAVDSQGNVAVGAATSTSKLDVDGNVLWTRGFQVAGNGHTHLRWTTVDGSDNIIRAGYVEIGNWAFLVVKYDPDGNLLWSTQVPHALGPEAIRAEVDEFGGIYVFGEVRLGPGAGHQFLTVKVEPDGTHAWSRTHAVGHEPRAMAVRDGQVVCAGHGSHRYVTVSYDYAGNELWSNAFHGSVGANDVAIGPSGQVAVCGWSTPPGTTTSYGTVVHYDASGAQSWVAYHNSPVGTDIFKKIAIDEQGAVITTGTGLTATPDDAWSTIKLDATGALEWAQLHDGVPFGQSNGFESATSLAVLPSGSVLVGGVSERPCSGFGLGGNVVKYTSDGAVEWVYGLGSQSTCLGGSPARVVPDPATGAILAYTHTQVWRLREPVGISECGPAVPNSTGAPATITATGSSFASVGELTLSADDLPTNTFGFFLASRTRATVIGPGGSQGVLCLGGTIGRFDRQIRSSGDAGSFSIAVDLANIPGVPPQAAMAGDVWSFQAWFRDANPSLTSNFTDAVTIQYR